MQLLIDFLVLWLSFGIIVVASVWYFAPIVARFWPQWWQREIVDIDPGSDRILDKWLRY